MNDVRIHHAKRALDEFVSPALNEIREAYAKRLQEVATTELSRDKRTDKITCLSTALRITDEIESIIRSVVLEGELAAKERHRLKKIEEMTPARRRLLNF